MGIDERLKVVNIKSNICIADLHRSAILLKTQ